MANNIDKVAWRGVPVTDVKLVGREFPLAKIDSVLNSIISRFSSSLSAITTIGRYGDIVGKRQEWVQLRGKSPKYDIIPYVPPKFGPALSSERAAFLSDKMRGAINAAGFREYTGRRFGTTNQSYDEVPYSESLYPLVTKKQADEWNAIRAREAQKILDRRTQAKYNIWRDSLDDYDKQVHDLSMRYAGAPNARDAAEKKIRQDALKKLPKFMAEMLKGTNINTKALLSLSRNSVISKLAAHPIAGTLAIAGVAAHWINNILDKSDKGNESVVGWQNAMNLYGKPSERFSNAAYLAGLKDSGKVSKLYGQLTMAFGNADMAMSVLGSGMKNLPPIARMAIAKQLGLDADVFAIMDIMSGRLSPDKARLTNAATNKQAVWKSLADSSTGSLSDTITAISSDALFGITGRIGARTSQEIINEAYSDRVNRQIESAINSYDNAQRSPMPNAGNNSSVSNSSTININGPITLPNVRDANGFVNDIENRASTRRAVLNDNEPTKR